jgi:signal transduction histidine kinase
VNRFFMRLIGGYRRWLFVLAVVVGLFLHFTTQRIVNGLRSEARSLVQFYAQLYARVAETESTEDLSFIFDAIILRTTFPLINTDVHKNPQWWKGISVDPEDRSDEALKKVEQMVRRMDREIEPVPIRYGDTVLGYLYYGDSRLIQQLRWLPTVEITVMGLFLLIGLVGYATIRRSEEKSIWVGMAKETAHQLGTPISSLWGWLEIIRTKKNRIKDDVIIDMEKDLRRLQQVTVRFSQIGSRPDLKRSDPIPVLDEAVDYIQRRVPQVGRTVRVIRSFAPVGSVALNPGLFGWAVENLLKNSLDALDKEESRIEVSLGPCQGGRRIFIEVQDNGKGMDASQKRKIFRPGFSTKKRGWGLGLTLAKRIVEEYHGGRLFVKETKPGFGTTMRIEAKTK